MNNYGEFWICAGVTSINTLAVLTSQEEHILYTLRCASMAVAIVAGILAIVAAVFRFVRWLKRDDD